MEMDLVSTRNLLCRLHLNAHHSDCFQYLVREMIAKIKSKRIDLKLVLKKMIAINSLRSC